MLRLLAEGTSDMHMVEVSSDQDSGSDSDDNLYLHFNYSIYAFLESKMGERESKMGDSWEKQKN